MFRSFIASTCALVLAASCAIGASPAAAQTVTGLSVLDAFKSVQNECQVIGTNGLYHPCEVMEGLFGGQPKPLSAESNGSLDVLLTNPSVVTRTVDAPLAASTIPTTLGSTYVVNLGAGQATAGFAVAGLTASGAILTSQYSNDNGLTWSVIRSIATDTQAPTATYTADGQFTLSASAHTRLRLIVTTSGTGSITIASNTSTAAKELRLGGLLPGYYTPPTFLLGSGGLGGSAAMAVYTTLTNPTPAITNYAVETGGALAQIQTNTSGLLKAGGTIVTGSGSVTTEVNSAAILTAQGADATGITQPTGGSGIRGWLSGIYKAITAPLAVAQSGAWTVGLSAGSQVVGAVTQSGGPWSVSCTLANCAVTTTPAAGSVQAVSQSGAWNVAAAIANGANVVEGSTTDAAFTGGTAAASFNALLRGIYAATAGPTPAGSAIIGKVGIDQTTPGATNGVQTLSGSVTTATIAGQPSIQGTDAEAAAVTARPVLIGGKDSTAKAHAAATDFSGSFRPPRGVYRTNPYSLGASSAAVIEDTTQQANRSTRMAMYVTLGAANTAPVYLCYNGQGTSCSASVWDDIIPVGTAIGNKTIPIFGSRAAVSAFSTAAVSQVGFTDIQPETN